MRDERIANFGFRISNLEKWRLLTPGFRLLSSRLSTKPMNPPRYLTGEEHPNLPYSENSAAALRPRLPFVERVDSDFIEDESGSLLEYWRILLRRKVTILLIALVGALAGFLVT